jgi:peroxiredoxin
MKRISFTLLLTIAFLLKTTAQTYWKTVDYSPYLGKGHFVIKGKVENKPNDMNYWEMASSGYFLKDNRSYKININEDGTFEQEIPIQDVQDVYFYLGDAITIFSYPGDTIGVYFDGNNRKESLSLKGKNADRQKELDLSLLIFRNFRQAINNMHKMEYNSDISDDEFYTRLNDYYDKKINLIKTFEQENGTFPLIDKFRNDTYFESADIATAKVSQITKLHCEYPTSITYWTRNGVVDTVVNLPYKYLDDNMLRLSHDYRSFLSSYISVSRSKLEYQSSSNTSFRDKYYFALSCLKSPVIRDWYLTNELENGFTYSDFNDVSFVYDEFKKMCNNKDYLELIEEKYQFAVKTQPGQKAPDFELKDENGKLVKLSDFKGKIVYMDFWDIYCGPCISEFKTSKDKMHEKYKDYDIVYMYICIDGDEKAWKEAIQKYNLNGVNLFAEKADGEFHQACKNYNVYGIPHYALIDKEGRIVKNKCDRPSSILMEGWKTDFEKFIEGL